MLGEQGGFVRALVQEVPEIRDIYEKGVREGWFDPGSTRGISLFQNAVRDSEWFKNNNQYFRNAWTLQRTDPAAFQEQVGDARDAITMEAASLGIELDQATLDVLAQRYVFEGWATPGRQRFLRNELSKRVGFRTEDGRTVMRGGPGQFVNTLRTIANSNGLNFSDQYYLSAARSVASGLRTEQDWEQDVREQAAGLYPVFAQQIRGGLNARDLASGFINLMAQEFEIDPLSITLDDPYIREALGGFTQEGTPQLMNLYDFRTRLRQDPRWMNTSAAQNQMASAGSMVLEMFGLAR